MTVSFGDVDPFGLEAVDRYEEELVRSNRAGVRVRALMLCSPHNPLGPSPPLHSTFCLLPDAPAPKKRENQRLTSQ